MTTTIYPTQFKEDAVRMLLRERRDAATVSRLLGVPTRTLLDWQIELRTEQPTLYQEMLAETRLQEPFPARPTVLSYTQELDEAQQQVRRLHHMNRTLRLAVIDLQAALMAQMSNRTVEETRRILTCWFRLPPLWRLAAAVHAGIHTTAELEQMDASLDPRALQLLLDQLSGGAEERRSGGEFPSAPPPLCTPPLDDVDETSR